ncbi:MAG: hypothetical protein HY812_21980 [Planctomycetes bacterium]|nr:hypothetical protein [Planctomycetota bacterium]
MAPDPAPAFACDAMMKGLARWLRACGYDATWVYGIDDDVLLEFAAREYRIVLTADAGIMARRAVKQGRPRALYVPNELPPREQARRTLAELRLLLRPARCMGCGGEVAAVDKESVRLEAPPRTFAVVESFQRCRRCGRLLWRGTHWERIEVLRRELAEPGPELEPAS